MSRLPVPDKPYADWSRFLSAVWMHGMSVQNIDKDIVATRADLANESIKEVFTRRNEASTIRPSAFLACARQTYFSVQGEDSGGMPDHIGSTFAVGHLLHELSYAAVLSAMPEGFLVEVEKHVNLAPWWPKDATKYNQAGHVDMLVTCTDPAVKAKYIPRQVNVMLVDFKTMGSYTYRKHGKTVWGEDPDAFGYLAQIAVYTDALGVIDSGAIVAGINRDSLTKPLLPRHISAEALKSELARVKLAIEMAEDGSDPGEEFLTRHGSDAYFQCGRGGRPGYCAFRDICQETPTRDGDGT